MVHFRDMNLSSYTGHSAPSSTHIIAIGVIPRSASQHAHSSRPSHVFSRLRGIRNNCGAHLSFKIIQVVAKFARTWSFKHHGAVALKKVRWGDRPFQRSMTALLSRKVTVLRCMALGCFSYDHQKTPSDIRGGPLLRLPAEGTGQFQAQPEAPDIRFRRLLHAAIDCTQVSPCFQLAAPLYRRAPINSPTVIIPGNVELRLSGHSDRAGA